MTNQQLKGTIQTTIQAFANGSLTENSLELFDKLGYITDRRAPLYKPTFEEFREAYISDQRFDDSKARIKEWKYVDLLFQLSKEEVSKDAGSFEIKQVDNTIIETYLFFALELTGDEYNRTDLSKITREVNRLFPMPVMILFKYGNKLTFSIINRRLHRSDESKDVLEKVTLIKDISIENPSRAHIEILFDLSFQELLSKHQFKNFVELHNAWQKTLDTKELNKRFYSELFNWYLWAVQLARFPNDVNDAKDDNVYNAESVIRLLTRLIFVWFIKEKNLVPHTLFNLNELKNILKNFQPDSGKTSVYYRAILQNLFFATLNTPMDKDITDENKDEKRQFINPDTKSNKEHYLDQTKYRYKDYFINPDKALELFSTIPFLNGGLFECLDFRDGNKEIRFDGFSSTENRQAFVPDKLFFEDKFDLDLNTEYGTKDKKYKVEGLINILDRYKFTITENTPLEEEIALDPELLGKVFENLLASYNPETKTTARKQTGSFYTPREIVNYMVDESLIAYFKSILKSSSPDTGEVARSAGGVSAGGVSAGGVSGGGVSAGGVSAGGVVRNLNNLPHLKTFRKTLRNNLTPAEAKLWSLLKGKQLGDKKFRRQFSVANYILDFYSPSESLAIELDGQGHFENSQAEYDYERDLFLQHCGIKVLRFENKWVWDNPDGLLEEIRNNFDWKNKRPLSQPMADSSPFEGEQLIENRLRDLFSHTADLPQFSEVERNVLIKAINDAKILDPACGSGAFPMGVLHRLVDLLSKLDPDNKQWNELQIQRAIDETAEVYKLEKDSDERKIRLNEIEKAFDQSINYPDYARKLFLIENCIYGVDIQQIAIQISKLRFFISLIVDQKVNDSKPNRNILSMPNLETKFVAANTLIGLDKPEQMSLITGDVERLEKELASIRHKIFFTRKYSAKKALKKNEKEKREELQTALTQSGFSKNVAGQIAGWNPFDPIQSAKFFDPETMFGIVPPTSLSEGGKQGGFDIVIGNPPYVQLQKDGGFLAKQFEKLNFETFIKTGDIYSLFYEKGIKLLKNKGLLTFITSNKWMRAGYGEKLRNYFLKFNPKILIDLGPGVFETATVDTNILLIEKDTAAKYNLQAVTIDKKQSAGVSIENQLKLNGVNLSKLSKDAWTISGDIEMRIKEKIERIGTPLKDWDIKIYRGVLTGYNEAFIIDGKKKDELIAQDPKSAEIIKPILRGRDIKRYKAEFADLWIINSHNGVKEKGIPRIDVPQNYPVIYNHLKQYEKELIKRQDKGDHWTNLRNCAYLEEFEKEIIVWKAVGRNLSFSMWGQGKYLTAPASFLSSENNDLKYLLSFLHSKYALNYILENSDKTGAGDVMLNIQSIEKLYIPIITPEAQQPFIDLVEKILSKKESNEDTTAEEQAIDELVYKLYELTDDEIKIVEGK